MTTERMRCRAHIEKHTIWLLKTGNNSKVINLNSRRIEYLSIKRTAFQLSKGNFKSLLPWSAQKIALTRYFIALKIDFVLYEVRLQGNKVPDQSDKVPLHGDKVPDHKKKSLFEVKKADWHLFGLGPLFNLKNAFYTISLPHRRPSFL